MCTLMCHLIDRDSQGCSEQCTEPYPRFSPECKEHSVQRYETRNVDPCENRFLRRSFHEDTLLSMQDVTMYDRPKRSLLCLGSARNELTLILRDATTGAYLLRVGTRDVPRPNAHVFVKSRYHVAILSKKSMFST